MAMFDKETRKIINTYILKHGLYKIKLIQSWREIEPYGIDLLTGEACGLAFRGLFDVTTEGKQLLESFLGGTVDIHVDSNWNGGSKNAPHVGSILLPYSILTDLAAFLLCKEAESDMGVATLKDGGAILYYGMVHNSYLEDRIARYFKRPTEVVKERNTHQMSGRTE